MAKSSGTITQQQEQKQQQCKPATLLLHPDRDIYSKSPVWSLQTQAWKPRPSRLASLPTATGTFTALGIGGGAATTKVMCSTALFPPPSITLLWPRTVGPMLLKSRAACAKRRTDNNSSTGAQRTRFLRFLGLCRTDSANLSCRWDAVKLESKNQALLCGFVVFACR